MVDVLGFLQVHEIDRGLVFVGNSHTYQPKELGGVPGAFARLAASCGHSVLLGLS